MCACSSCREARIRIPSSGRRAPKTRPEAPFPGYTEPAPSAGSASPADGGASAQADPIERELAGRVLTEEGAFAEVADQGGAICFRSESLRDLLNPWFGE